MKRKLGLALGLAAVAAWIASPWPDGLGRVAENMGFLGRGREAGALLAGYAFPGLDGSKLAGVFAGMIGVLLVFGFFWVIAFVMERFTRTEKNGSNLSPRT